MVLGRSLRAIARLMLLLGVLFSGPTLASGLDISLDRTRILEGETVLLTLVAPGDSWGIPDLDALGADFDVKNQGQSTRMTIVNGRSTSTREWQLLLAPKRSGKLTVPPLRVGDLASEPIELEVLPAAQAAELGESLPVVLEVQVDDETPYVQGQVVYTVRVLLRVDVRNASLEDPSADGVITERLGDDRRYQTYREGQRYQVIERRYAIFPQHSGELEIRSPVLSGSIPERSGTRDSLFGGSARDQFDRLFGRDPFEDMGGVFQRTRPIQVRGPELTLNVRPQPHGSASPWLPAESLELAETWAPDPNALRVGDPVTRTIAITAQGLTAAQLPDLAPEVADGIKIYPDKPRMETRAEGGTIVSMREVKLAMVPSSPGRLTLPEVRVVWWDTGANQERVAALPARIVEVLPAIEGTASAAAGLPEPMADPPVRPLPAVVPGAPPGPDVEQAAANGYLSGSLPYPAGYWPWLTAVLGALWLSTLLFLLRQRGRVKKSHYGQAPAREPGPRMSRSAARTAVKRACAANDAKAARDALLQWAAACWPKDPPRRLESLAARLGGSAGEALRRLDRSLYAAGERVWDGDAAWDSLGPAISEVSGRRVASDRESGALPQLYPRTP